MTSWILGVLVAATPVELSLPEAQRLAAARSPALAARRAQQEGAEHRVGTSTARLLPKLSLGVRYSRLSYVAPGEITLPFSLPNQPAPEPIRLGDAIENVFASSVVLEQPVFTGLSLLNQREAAQHTNDAASHLVEQDQQDLALRVEESWFGLLRARQLLSVTEQSERVLGAHLARLERLAEAGSTTGLEVTRTRARLASVRVQTLQAKAAEAMAQLSLIITLGLEPDAVLELREPLDDAPPADDEQRRPELLAARAQVAAKQAQARAAAGGLWPQIALRASVQLDSPNSRYFPLRNQLNPSWEASAILSWTAWDWGATWHGLRAAQLDAQAAHHGVEQLEDAVRLEVARRRLDVTTAAARTVATREAVDAADQSFQRAQRQCDEGQLACIIALDAEAELSRLRADLVQARIEQRLSAAQLRRALGTLTPRGTP